MMDINETFEFGTAKMAELLLEKGIDFKSVRLPFRIIRKKTRRWAPCVVCNRYIAGGEYIIKQEKLHPAYNAHPECFFLALLAQLPKYMNIPDFDTLMRGRFRIK